MTLEISWIPVRRETIPVSRETTQVSLEAKQVCRETKQVCREAIPADGYHRGLTGIGVRPTRILVRSDGVRNRPD